MYAAKRIDDVSVSHNLQSGVVNEEIDKRLEEGSAAGKVVSFSPCDGLMCTHCIATGVVVLKSRR